MEKSLHVEGLLFIPPNTMVKNPHIKITPHGLSFQEGEGKGFTHKGVAIPSLINCHAHLDITEPIYATSFISWIEKIIRNYPKARRVAEDAEKTIEKLKKLGISTTFDITRDPKHPCIGKGVVPFLEITGDDQTPLPQLPPGYMVSPHAVYSTTPKLLKKVAETYRDKLISIHVAECEEEAKFLRGKPNLIEERIYPLVGRRRSIGTYRSSVEILEETGILGPRTILVHCCFIDDMDMEAIGRHGASVCICPRSNLYLSGRLAPVRKLLERGINLLIGTDSLGSTPNLNLWEEARTLYLIEKLPPQEILAMLTTNPRRLIRDDTILVLDIPPSQDPAELSFRLLFEADSVYNSYVKEEPR